MNSANRLYEAYTKPSHPLRRSNLVYRFKYGSLCDVMYPRASPVGRQFLVGPTKPHFTCRRGAESSLEPPAASLVNIASNYLNSGLEATRHGTAHPSIVPYQAFQSKDGYIMVGAGNNKQFQILCQCLQLNDVGQDPAYSTNRDRVANRDTLLEILQARFHSKTTKDWEMVFQGSGIPYGPINNMKDVFSDPQTVTDKTKGEYTFFGRVWYQER